MKIYTTTMAVCVLLGAFSACLGQSLPGVAYVQRVGTGTAIPGGTGNFASFPVAPSVAIDSSGSCSVTFTGRDASLDPGVYRYGCSQGIQYTVELVANQSTELFGGDQFLTPITLSVVLPAPAISGESLGSTLYSLHIVACFNSSLPFRGA